MSAVQPISFRNDLNKIMESQPASGGLSRLTLLRRENKALLKQQCRRCPRCLDIKTLENFGVDNRRASGKSVYCLDCSRCLYSIYYKNNKDAVKSNSRIRYALKPVLERQKILERVSKSHKYRRAIDDGKHSKLCKLHGFYLVLRGDNQFRAIRMDRWRELIELGETVLQGYRYAAASDSWSVEDIH